MSVKTFAELERTELVNADDLMATLENYAQMGAAISPRVVIALIQRTGLTATDRAQLLKSAEKGLATQIRMRESRAAQEYQDVVNYLRA